MPATETDFAEEYLSLDIAAAVVDSLDAALAHIRRYSTGHSETIVTESQARRRRFTAEVDAAAVLVNASSRFVDGGEFGFGAEIGISTQKLHARGPMGLPEMTSTKYVVVGAGQVRPLGCLQITTRLSAADATARCHVNFGLHSWRPRHVSSRSRPGASGSIAFGAPGHHAVDHPAPSARAARTAES